MVNDVSLAMATGETVGLLGPNGAGKTTTFYMMVGLVRPDDGRVTLDGQDITQGQPMFMRGAPGLGYLAQEPSVFRKLTVAENVMLVLKCTESQRKSSWQRPMSCRVSSGFSTSATAWGQVLSGGERRAGGDSQGAGDRPPVHPAR